VILKDGRIILAGKLKDADLIASLHFEPRVTQDGKLDLLQSMLSRQEGAFLVFARTKRGAERLARRLSDEGIKTAAIHGDRTQEQRMAAVEGFRGGRHKVLVATDIAARGLDIDGITFVINYEVPTSPEAYVHRVGRTGRDLTTGTALTLVAPEETRALQALQKSFGLELQG